MNLLLLFSLGSFKKQLYFAMAMLLVILCLPIMAVFSLGTSALSILTFGHGATAQADGLYEGALVTGDSYAWGNCTYWVYKLRQDAGDPIPTSWGNANTWALNALLQGYQEDHTPTVNAIMQTSGGSLGHVAYVTAVDSTTGDWTISEMNVLGLDVVDTKVNKAVAAYNYTFIHDKANLQVKLNLGALQTDNL